MEITILGGGSWGTALAVHLAKKGNNVKVWEFVVKQAEEMQKTRFCPMLPGAKLPKNIFVSPKMEEAIKGSKLIFLVVPSTHAGATMEKAGKLMLAQPVVICSKGFADGSRLLSEVVREKITGNVYCLYGPTHAEEVCKGMFSGIVLGGKDCSERKKIKEAVESPTLKVELNEDVIGMQVSAVLKNILAVFVGVLDGKGLGDNAKAFVMTKGLEEIRAIGLKLGAKESTFYGLAGIGDVIVTCTSKHSRNRYVGEQVGKGRKLDEVIAEMSMVAEGVAAVKSVIQLNEKLGTDIPLISGLHDILFAGRDVEEVLREL
ncbi:MAG: NAD(P)H-dependent glycerol-3-phosphate dehydrogenase [Nanoarchaeota archaeon]